jgi:hypothetical protein
VTQRACEMPMCKVEYRAQRADPDLAPTAALCASSHEYRRILGQPAPPAIATRPLESFGLAVRDPAALTKPSQALESALVSWPTRQLEARATSAPTLHGTCVAAQGLRPSHDLEFTPITACNYLYARMP